MNKILKVKIARQDPLTEEGFTYESYELPYEEGLAISDVIRTIYENHDPTLGHRDYRCGRGSCGSCSVILNGRKVRSCITAAKPDEELIIEPFGKNVIIRDLAVRFDYSKEEK